MSAILVFYIEGLQSNVENLEEQKCIWAVAIMNRIQQKLCSFTMLMTGSSQLYIHSHKVF